MLKKLDNIKDKLIDLRRDFHKYPEVAWTEMRTASIIAKNLNDLGYKLLLGKDVLTEEDRMGLPNDLEKHYLRAKEQGADPFYLEKVRDGFTCVVGVLKISDGPTTAIRVDIDALNINESESSNHFPVIKGFRSVNENTMHACGHDAHITIGLGLAEMIMSIKDDLCGTIKIIFQPAEEGVKGGKALASSGILDDVDYLLGGHIGIIDKSSQKLFCGVKDFLATSKLDVTFKGISSHAGISPQEGKNALLAAATSVVSLNTISRHSDGVTRVNVGKLYSGTQRNIIPSDANMEIETRGESSELNEYMKENALRIIKSSAEMYDVKYEIKEIGSAFSGSSNFDLMKRIKAIKELELMYKHVICEDTSFPGSEDFTYLMDKVKKSTYLIFGSDIKAPHHNENFDFEECDMINAIKVLMLIIRDLNKLV